MAGTARRRFLAGTAYAST